MTTKQITPIKTKPPQGMPGTVPPNSTAVQRLLGNLSNLMMAGRKQVFCLRELLQEIGREYAMTGLPPGVGLKATCPRGPICVPGSRKDVRLTVRTLIDRAVNSLSGDGAIRLDVRLAEASLVEISITDNGPGLSKEEIRGLIEAVHYGEEYCRLSTALGRHRSRFRVSSRLGVGTRVEFTLPHRPEAVATLTPLQEPMASAANTNHQ